MGLYGSGRSFGREAEDQSTSLLRAEGCTIFTVSVCLLNVYQACFPERAFKCRKGLCCILSEVVCIDVYVTAQIYCQPSNLGVNISKFRQTSIGHNDLSKGRLEGNSGFLHANNFLQHMII